MSGEDKPLVNRVAASGLITLNLEEFYPNEEIVEFDIKDFLYMELLLKEKEFRTKLKELDWSIYRDKSLAVFCSNDAIIPVWAYQLIAINAAQYAKDIVFGNKERFLEVHYYKVLNEIEVNDYQDKRIVIKGCSNKPVPPSAYMELARLLQPVVKSIMYGEPCSTVPLYKKPRTT